MVAVVDPGRAVDRAALGHRAGRHDLSARGARRGGACGAWARRWSPASPRRSPTISSSPRRSTPSAWTASPTSSRSSCPADRRAGHQPARGRDPRPGAARRRACGAQRDHRRLRRRLLSCSSEEEIAAHRVRRASPAVRLQRDARSAGFPSRASSPRCRTAIASTPSDLAAAALTIEIGRSRRARNVAAAARRMGVPPGPLGRRGALPRSGLARDDGVPPVAEDDLPLLANLLDQVALALERARLEARAREVAALRERDRLRSALLSSVGHDLRTPLTAIIGAAAELRADGAGPALLATIESEAGKLERYISNLLDMARIEAGAREIKDRARGFGRLGCGRDAEMFAPAWRTIRSPSICPSICRWSARTPSFCTIASSI